MDPSRYLTRLRSGVDLPPAMAPSWQAPTYDSAPKTRSDWFTAHSTAQLHQARGGASRSCHGCHCSTRMEICGKPLHRSCAQRCPEVEMWERPEECWGQGRTSHLHTSTLHIDLPLSHKHTHSRARGGEERRTTASGGHKRQWTHMSGVRRQVEAPERDI